MTRAPTSLQSLMAIDDTPLPAAWTTTVCPGFTWAFLKTICHAVTVHRGNAASSVKLSDPLTLMRLTSGRLDVAGVAALRVLAEQMR